MNTYTLKLIKTKSPYYFYHIYDGDTMLTDAQITTLLSTEGSAKFRFDFDSFTGSISYGSIYVVDTAGNTTKIYKGGLPTVEPEMIKEDCNFIGTWYANAGAFTSFAREVGKTLSDDQLSFLMHQIKNAGKVKLYTTQSFLDPVFVTDIPIYRDEACTQKITGGDFYDILQSGANVTINYKNTQSNEYFSRVIIGHHLPSAKTAEAFDAWPPEGWLNFTSSDRIVFNSSDPTDTDAFIIEISS